VPLEGATAWINIINKSRSPYVDRRHDVWIQVKMESRVGNPLSTIQSRDPLPTSPQLLSLISYSSLGLQTLRSERELVESEITALFREKNAIQKVQNTENTSICFNSIHFSSLLFLGHSEDPPRVDAHERRN
jgi:hypothetical protein